MSGRYVMQISYFGGRLDNRGINKGIVVITMDGTDYKQSTLKGALLKVMKAIVATENKEHEGLEGWPV